MLNASLWALGIASVLIFNATPVDFKWHHYRGFLCSVLLPEINEQQRVFSKNL
jgi:hypothetical protein